MRTRTAGRRPRPAHWGPDAGAATAELATALPAVVMLLGLVLATANGVQTRLQCLDAAAVGARLASRAEPVARVEAAAGAVGPPGAEVHVAETADEVIVSVTALVRMPLPGAPHLAVVGRASAPREPR